VNTTESATYDYVIVGGGSAGSVVASRLAAAQPDATVLLIEAGPAGRGVAQIVDPPQWTKLGGTALDWGYSYAPSACVAGRAVPLPRGKVLGGCSATNAMQWFRGHADDYDAWERAISEFAATRIGQPADSLYPLTVGRATLAACRAAYDRWSARADADLTFYLDAALAALAAGFDPDVIRASAQALSQETPRRIST